LLSASTGDVKRGTSMRTITISGKVGSAAMIRRSSKQRLSQSKAN